MSEAIIDAISKNLISNEQMEELDPAIMFSIPRLTLLFALQRNSEILNLTDPKSNFGWFKNKIHILAALESALRDFSLNDKSCLESLLANQSSLSTDVDYRKKHIQNAFRDICNVADEIQSDIRGRDLSALMLKVFAMFKQ